MTECSPLTPQLRGVLKAFGGIGELKRPWAKLDQLLAKYGRSPSGEIERKINAFLRTEGMRLTGSVKWILPPEDHPSIWGIEDGSMHLRPSDPIYRLLIMPQRFREMQASLDMEARGIAGRGIVNHDCRAQACVVVELALDKLNDVEVELISEDIIAKMQPRDREILSAPGLIEISVFNQPILAKTLDRAGKEDERFRPDGRAEWSGNYTTLQGVVNRIHSLGVIDKRGATKGASIKWTPVGRRVILRLSEGVDRSAET